MRGKSPVVFFFVILTSPYKNAMFRFTAMRIRYYVSMDGLHMPCGSFEWITFLFARWAYHGKKRNVNAKFFQTNG